MTRIVGGRFGGRRLTTPAGAATRPTGEKVRAALANALTAAGGLDGARVLDLYAGSGAIGLELLSRGARSVVLVDNDHAAIAAIRANVAALGVDGAVDVVNGTVAAPRWSQAPADRFDIVVADPPYDVPTEEVTAVLATLWRSGAVAPGADLVVERSVRAGEQSWPEPLTAVRTKRYGDTLLCYGRAP